MAEKGDKKSNKEVMKKSSCIILSLHVLLGFNFFLEEEPLGATGKVPRRGIVTF
jgi:hypothetical protein|tara:strand:+ start:577 stop:738 length:162 start_codon:yes stop_codon:yes gene_type:complete